MRAILVGILASFFFSATFIINRVMSTGGTSWAWTASLRFLFAIPFLLLLVIGRKGLKELLAEMQKNIGTWLLWGTCGGVGFYSLLSFASAYSPSWLTSGTWQITILAGALLSPLFYVSIHTNGSTKKIRQKIPFKSLRFSLIILLGVILMQVKEANQLTFSDFLFGFIPVVVAAFLYPLGNRKMMEVCQGKLDTFQRTLGMALSSIPVALLLALFGYQQTGLPTAPQFLQILLLAIFSGVIATILFFVATDLAKSNMALLAAVESTQAGAMIFTILGEVIILNGPFPQGLSLIGMILVILGMLITSIANRR